MSYFKCKTLNALLKLSACLARRTAKKFKGEVTTCMACKDWRKFQVGLIGDREIEGKAQALLTPVVVVAVRRSNITIIRRKK